MSISSFERAGLAVFERGWLSSNNIFFRGGGNDGSVLVDSGYSTHSAQTVQLVRSALRGAPLDRVVNTHLHSDHCGGNHALQREFGCSVDVSAGEARKVDEWDEAALSYRGTGQECPAFVRDRLLRDGELVRLGDQDWEVIHTPGHDPESVAFYHPGLAILISADALWENGFGVIFPELEGRAGFADERSTLDRLASLRVDWVIPGHGRPFQDMASAIDRALRRLDAFEANPLRHAQHAAKVLIKFHLLEVQSAGLEDLLAWASATDCLRQTHRVHVAGVDLRAWIATLLADLRGSGALTIEDNLIKNC